MGRAVKRVLLLVGVIIAFVVLTFYAGQRFLWYHWRHHLSAANEMLLDYEVCPPPADDTLRVLMIGDSWAGIHNEGNYDSLLAKHLQMQANTPAKFQSHGRGGAKSKDVYRLMVMSAVTESERKSGYCTQPLLQKGADYCVIIAGINDAVANLGVDYYCRNYYLILKMLRSMAMCPVVVEIPYVDIVDSHSAKPLRHKLSDWLKAKLTRSQLYDVVPYSKALLDSIHSWGWKDSVLVLRKEQWNPEGVNDRRGLYQCDGVHLNSRGYSLLDSSLAVVIAADWKKRHRKNLTLPIK